MELKYTHIDDSMDSATMLIKGMIGGDVDGAEFVNEIKYLEKLGVQNLEIRINSGGGSVLHGYDIVDALLNTPMNTTSYIAGMAASMAGVIAMAAKRIKIVNFGILMIHSAGGTDNKEVIKKFNHSLVAIFNSRTGIDKAYLEKLMNTETFFTAEEALTAGFVDEIVETKRTINQSVHNSSFEELVNIYNEIKIEDMEENKDQAPEILNENEAVNEPASEETQPEIVAEDATEETAPEAAAESAPEAVSEPATEPVSQEEVVAEPVVEASELAKKNEELVEANAELMKRLAELETTHNALVEKENLRLKSEKEARELAVLNDALESGKITNEVKDTWMNFIAIDFEGAKKALDGIITNKTSVDIMAAVSKTATNSMPAGKTHRELEVENPSELLRIKNETPEIYRELYKASYGAYPSL